MSDLSDDDLTTGLTTVKQSLETLKEENTSAQARIEAALRGLKTDEGQLPKAKMGQVQENLGNITKGYDDLQMIFAVLKYQQKLEADKNNYRIQYKRLCQQYGWLEEEIYGVRQKLQESERRVAVLEEENKQLTYLNSIKMFDEDIKSNKAADPTPVPSTSETLQDLGFGPDDEYDMNASQYNPSGAYQTTNSGSIVHEMSSRIKTLHNLVQQYIAQGKYEVAVPLCKQTIEDLQKTPGHEADIATMLNILALVYKDEKKYKEAATALNNALAIREKCLGVDHPDVAATLNNICVLLGRQAKYKEAEPLCKRALEIREKSFGKDHPVVAKQLVNLALIIQNLGRYSEMEEHLKRADEIYEAKLGPDDPATSKTKNHISTAYLKQGKYEEAETLYKQILTRAHEKEFGKVEDANKPIWQIAEEREKNKDNNGEAQEQNSQFKVPKVNNPVVSSTLKNLSALYRRQRKYEAAETLDDVCLRAKKQNEPLRSAGGGVEDFMSMTASHISRMTGSQSAQGIKGKLLNALGFNE